MLNYLLKTTINTYCPKPRATRIFNSGSYFKICNNLETAFDNGVDLKVFVDKLNSIRNKKNKIQAETVSYDSLAYILADQSLSYKLDKLNRILMKSMFKQRFSKVFNYQTNSTIS